MIPGATGKSVEGVLEVPGAAALLTPSARGCDFAAEPECENIQAPPKPRTITNPIAAHTTRAIGLRGAAFAGCSAAPESAEGAGLAGAAAGTPGIDGWAGLNGSNFVASAM